MNSFYEDKANTRMQLYNEFHRAGPMNSQPICLLMY